jgi:hypothetical protein
MRGYPAIAVFFVLFIAVTLLLPRPVFAVEEETKKSKTSDEFLEGFDDDTIENAAPELPKNEVKPSIFSINGDIGFSTSYNFAHDRPKENETDWRGLSRLRTELNLELNAKFSSSLQARISGKGAYDSVYSIKDRDEFTDKVIDNYEKELELAETYIQGSLTKRLDIKLGRQIVVWGKSDNIRVTDILNPLDIREPGLTDIEDLRLPAAMSRLDYYIGDWNLTGIAIHEIRFNKTPEYGSDFYPGFQSPPYEDKPDFSIKNTEYAAAINAILCGWDISFYWADYYNDIPHMELVSVGLSPQTQFKHTRLRMFGAAFNAAVGNWLLKTEASFINGLEFFNTKDKKYSRTDILAGIEYSGFKDTFISIEAVNRHINAFNKALEFAPDEAQKDKFQWMVRLTRDFLNESLVFTLLASTYGATGQDGSFQRFSTEYDINDSVKIAGGVVLYQSGDLAGFRNIGDNDRLFFEIKYSF